MSNQPNNLAETNTQGGPGRTKDVGKPSVLMALGSSDGSVLRRGQPSNGNRLRLIGGRPRWKRPLDLAVALWLLLVLAPVFGLVVAWIKLSSGGPVFFRLQYIGYLGRPFSCFKFRTMQLGSSAPTHQEQLSPRTKSGFWRVILGVWSTTRQEQLSLRTKSGHPVPKIDLRGDPRLTVCGRFLRKFSLDELPLLWNVVRGEMSLVGPSPSGLYEVERYTSRHWERFMVPPGLTGLWQVSGRNRTSFEEMIDLDLYYAKKASLLLDLSILWRTMLVTIRGHSQS